MLCYSKADEHDQLIVKCLKLKLLFELFLYLYFLCNEKFHTEASYFSAAVYTYQYRSIYRGRQCSATKERGKKI